MTPRFVPSPRMTFSPYSSVAAEYAELTANELDNERSAVDRGFMAGYAELVAASGRTRVLDLGCGPGHATVFLGSLGLEMVGLDVAPEMIRFARDNGVAAGVGDLANLPVRDKCADGIVSRFSIIHFAPHELQPIFDEFARSMVDGGHLLLSFFGADDSAGHGGHFDHQAATAYRLDPDTIARQLSELGFEEVALNIRQPPPGQRLRQGLHVSLLARKQP